MIYSIGSSDGRFNSLAFHPGLNVLLADQLADSAANDTRNGAGKSSLVLLLHFLLGGNAGQASIFQTPELRDWTFEMDFDLGDERCRVRRSGATHNKVEVAGAEVADPKLALETDGAGPEAETISNSTWSDLLEARWFPRDSDGAPSVRSLLSYFIRHVEDGGFNDPVKNTYQQRAVEHQTAISYLLDLNWKLASGWMELKKQEETVQALSKALKDGRLGNYTIGSTAKLFTRLTLAEKRASDLRNRIAEFRVVDSFRELEAEANQISSQIRKLSEDNTFDQDLLSHLRDSYDSEVPPNGSDVAAMYEELGINFGDILVKRFDEVAVFHESIVRNRESHLAGEMRRAEQRISDRSAEQSRLDARKREILRTLDSGGALAELSGLQDELARESAEVEELRRSLEIATKLADGKAGVKRERQRLQEALKQDLVDRENQMRAIITRFQDFSSRLYGDNAGSLVVDPTEQGPKFTIEIESKKSVGIGNMQVFCFDLLMAEVSARRGVGPGFLVHDSHIFDGVDERQVALGLALASEVATDSGFQYIVTMNSDTWPSIFPDGFNPDEAILKTRLTDQGHAGRLFGVRF